MNTKNLKWEISGKTASTKWVSSHLIIDSEDIPKFNAFCGSITVSAKGPIVSIRSNGKTTNWTVGRHIILGLQKMACVSSRSSLVVDHINHNRFDNRKENLRVCTWIENMWNKSPRNNRTLKSKGVTYLKDQHRRKRYRANITVNGKHIDLGRYETETQAADAYDAAAEKHFRQFAYTNRKQQNEDKKMARKSRIELLTPRKVLAMVGKDPTELLHGDQLVIHVDRGGMTQSSGVHRNRLRRSVARIDGGSEYLVLEVRRHASLIDDLAEGIAWAMGEWAGESIR